MSVSAKIVFALIGISAACAVYALRQGLGGAVVTWWCMVALYWVVLTVKNVADWVRAIAMEKVRAEILEGMDKEEEGDENQ